VPEIIVEEYTTELVGEEVVDVVEVIEEAIPGPPGQPASLGGSLRSVSSKAEAGGPWTVVADDDLLQLSTSNRFIVIVQQNWPFAERLNPANPPAGTTLAIKIVNSGGSYDWTGVFWPNNNTPSLVDDGDKVTSLAFEKLPNGQWLGFVGPVHLWNGV